MEHFGKGTVGKPTRKPSHSRRGETLGVKQARTLLLLFSFFFFFLFFGIKPRRAVWLRGCGSLLPSHVRLPRRELRRRHGCSDLAPHARGFPSGPRHLRVCHARRADFWEDLLISRSIRVAAPSRRASRRRSFCRSSVPRSQRLPSSSRRGGAACPGTHWERGGNWGWEGKKTPLVGVEAAILRGRVARGWLVPPPCVTR